MTHASQDFTAHVLGLLKTPVPPGPSGPSPRKPLFSNEKVGTLARTRWDRLENDRPSSEFEWSRQRTEKTTTYGRWDRGTVGPVFCRGR